MIDIPESVRTLIPGVEARYSEPQRHYHDLVHLKDVLAGVQELAAHATDAKAVWLAALYHDAVYDPARKDNEEQSAALATRELTAAGVFPGLVTEVHRLVLTTKNHLASVDANARTLADADCRVLAGTPAQYAHYARGIRKEYGMHPWPAYAAGRSAFLRKMLAGGRVFFFRGPEADARAMANMRREVAALSVPKVILARLLGRDPLAAL